MRWLYFILLQVLLVAVIAGIFYLHKDRVAVIKLPPASLAQWYKPDNKRQVWLHNMFKLRREIQAARFYAENEDARRLEKWVARLSEHYRKIGEMVPEWNKQLDMKAITRLQESASSNRYPEVSRALDQLKESCESCHADYRAVTAAMYRAPDFSTLKPGTASSFKDRMKELIEQVNRIKIASEDGKQDMALAALSDLQKGMHVLGETCSDCHKKDTPAYPGTTIIKTITRLHASLETGTLKEQGRDLGTLAVQACARCHGTHRIASDSRLLFTDRQSWVELLKH